jgi:NADPH:quinone reductase-like Zn-dependent oxidoreductase
MTTRVINCSGNNRNFNLYIFYIFYLQYLTISYRLLNSIISADFKQGDEIYGQASVLSGGSGAFAELALANEDSIAHKPKTLNQLEAAALPTVGVSAWQALVENIGLSKEQRILIHGEAGGVGSIAIQLAKHLGAYVATTVSTNDKQQFCTSIGSRSDNRIQN